MSLTITDFKIPNSVGVSAKTAKDAMVQGGLDWTVSQHPIMTELGGNLVTLEKYKSVVRDDTNDVLSIMGSTYKPLQNKEKFDWADGLVVAGDALFTSVGYFGNGAVNWLLAELPGSMNIGNEKDMLKKYLLFADSYNGSLSFVTKFTTIRPVCANTFAAAIAQNSKEAGQTQLIKHTPNMLNKIADVRKSLGLVDAYYEQLAEQLKRLAGKKLKADESEAFFQKMMHWSEEGQNVSTRSDNIRGSLVDLYNGDAIGAGLAGDTAWGALNAVTEYVDHHIGIRGTDTSNRTKSAWFGPGEKMKQEAFNMLIDFTNDNLALVPINVKVGKVKENLAEMEVPA